MDQPHTTALPRLIFAVARSMGDVERELPHIASVAERQVGDVRPALARTAAALRALTPLLEELHRETGADADLAAHLTRLSDVLVRTPLSPDPAELRVAAETVVSALADAELQRWFLSREGAERHAFVLGRLVGPLEAGVRWNVRTVVGLSAFPTELPDLPAPLLEQLRALALLDGAELDSSTRSEVVTRLAAICAAYDGGGSTAAAPPPPPDAPAAPQLRAPSVLVPIEELPPSQPSDAPAPPDAPPAASAPAPAGAPAPEAAAPAAPAMPDAAPPPAPAAAPAQDAPVAPAAPSPAPASGSATPMQGLKLSIGRPA